MLISPSSLPAKLGKIQKNIKTKVRPVGLINIKTKKITKYDATYESGLQHEATFDILPGWFMIYETASHWV